MILSLTCNLIDQKENFSISDTYEDTDEYEYFDDDFENSLIEKTTIVNISKESDDNKETQLDGGR